MTGCHAQLVASRPALVIAWVVLQVTDSINLSGYGIVSATMLDVSAFENVRTMTLAHNKLTTLVGFGLERLSKLQKLDVHDNAIESVSCV